MNASMPMLITFIIYILIMITIGFIAYRSTKSIDDYILGGRRLGSVVTALSAGASDMSGWLLMGLPGAIFIFGLSKSWIAIGLIIGAYLNWRFVAGRLRVHTEVNHNALTIPDYLSSRFEDKNNVLRIISAIVILIFFTIYCSAGVVAGAQLFQNTFGISYEKALWVGAAATILYTSIGGFLAVSWTDSIQATLMIFALLLTPIFVLLSVGGIDKAISEIAIQKATNLSMVDGISIAAILSAVGWGLGYFGQPHILARFMAADSYQVIKNARRISMIWMILCLAGAVAAGFFGIAYFIEHPEQAAGVNQNNEWIFIELAKVLFNPWLVGIILSAILAAIMSTLSCQLLVCSSALTEDLYKVFVRPKASQKELVWVSRSMVLAVAVVAILLVQDPNSKVLNLVDYAWSGFGAAFGPVILLSVLWKRITWAGALSGMIVGAVTVLIWQQFFWFGLSTIIPGFVLATISIIVVSSMTKPSDGMVKRFEQADAEIKSYH